MRFRDLLDTVLYRGELRCGVSTAFSETQPDGSQTGFDADYCRAVAAALFGDASAVLFYPLTEREWPTAVETGEIDVLMRNLSEDWPIVSTYWQYQSQSRFADVVSDIRYASLLAWEAGINSANADATSVRDLLNRDASIGLAPAAFLQVIKQVGNYGEIGSRHGLW